MASKHCTYGNCLNSSENSDLQFFHYPTTDFHNCLTWLKNANQVTFGQLSTEELANKAVCQLHFEDGCFTNETKKDLVPDAIPTLDAFQSKAEVNAITLQSSSSNETKKDFILDPNPSLDAFRPKAKVSAGTSQSCSSNKTKNEFIFEPMTDMDAFRLKAEVSMKISQSSSSNETKKGVIPDANPSLDAFRPKAKVSVKTSKGRSSNETTNDFIYEPMPDLEAFLPRADVSMKTSQSSSSNATKQNFIPDAIVTLIAFRPKAGVSAKTLQSSSTDVSFNMNNIDAASSRPTCSGCNAKKMKIDHNTEKHFSRLGGTSTKIKRQSVPLPSTNNILPTPLKHVITENGAIVNEVEYSNITNISNEINRNSNELSRFCDTLRKHILINNRVRQLEKKLILMHLRRAIPPSLYSIVALHLATSKIHFTEEQKAFFKSLCKRSPTAYKFLIDNNWKLPSPEFIEKLNQDNVEI